MCNTWINKATDSKLILPEQMIQDAINSFLPIPSFDISSRKIYTFQFLSPFDWIVY